MNYVDITNIISTDNDSVNCKNNVLSYENKYILLFYKNF